MGENKLWIHRRPEQERNFRDHLAQPCHVTDKNIRLQEEEVRLPGHGEISKCVCGEDQCHLGGLRLCLHRALIYQPWTKCVPALTLHLSLINITKTSHKRLVVAPRCLLNMV